MKKSILLLLIGLIISGCNSSNDSTQFEKYSVEKINKLEYKKALEIGIKYYKSKKNRIARPFLKRAYSFENKLDGNKKGIASYYFGNVLMNLKEYTKAIDAYSNANFAKYKEKNSVFNIACAYSLLEKYKLALFCLIDNYQHGDRNFNRIKRDTDLISFRKSKYYNAFFKLIKYPDEGFSPKTKADLMKHMIFGKDAPRPDTMTPGYTRIESNGFFVDSGGPQNYWPTVGTWEIDEINKIFIIKEYGKSNLDNFRHIKSIKETKKYKKFKKVKTYNIPFKNIRLNIKGLYGGFHLQSYDKFVKGVIGTSRKDGTRIIFGKYFSIEK